MKHANKQTISLQRIDIATPCMASWDDMQGDERVRHCKDCNKNVFNLSAMPEVEAAQLLAANTGDLCVRFYQRRDGTVMTSDCGDSPRAMVRQAWRRLPQAAGAAVLALSAAGAVAGAAAPGAGNGKPAPAVEEPYMQVTMGAPPAPMEAKPVESKIPLPPEARPVPQKRVPAPPRAPMGKVSNPDVPEPAGGGAQAGMNAARAARAVR